MKGFRHHENYPKYKLGYSESSKGHNLYDRKMSVRDVDMLTYHEN